MGKAKENPLRRFFPNLNRHLSGDKSANPFSGRSLGERIIATLHWIKCRECPLHKENVDRPASDQMLKRYREVFDSKKLPYSEEPRNEFIRRLDLQLQTIAPAKRRPFRFPAISLPELPPMNPALVTCMVFAFATVLSFYFWWQQRTPRISSNALLVRAERWDTPNLAPTPSVVYQAVRITMTKESKKETIARSIYRDVQGKRQPKHVKLNGTEEQLKNTLTEAGLDWDEPLSASGYQSWHDRQHIREDHIARAGAHLLRLTTTVPEGLVAEQSLTVRDSDFHPVRRTVALRDSGTVEIAEVDFKILPWNAVDANAFEPLESSMPSVVTSPGRVLPFLRLPVALTEGQLDEAELGARLMLNQLHADTGEQLEIHRSPQGVAIAGVVETEERKRDLQSRLQTVPHVTSEIQTVGEASANPSPATEISSVAVASMPDQSSPLQEYLRAKGQSVDAIADLGERLFQNALTISQESRDIADLQSRFGSGEQRTVLASATLSELIYSHHERLTAALQQERKLLAEAGGSAATSQPSDAMQAASLVAAADRNLALAKELIQTNHPAAKPAEKILVELSAAVTDLAAEAQQAYGKSQGNTALSGKK